MVLDFRFGSKADITPRPLHVCFTSESRHPSERLTCPLCAINGPQFGFEGEYCIASHTAAARKAGMTEAMFGELMVAPFCERLPRNKAGEINHRTGGAGQLARAASRVTFAAKRLLCARFKFALVAQLDRASDFESEGRRFESVRARQENQRLTFEIPIGCFPENRLGKRMGSKQKIWEFRA